ncbi:MAG: DNA replication/repair protein RecF [Clostridia bacterium]
MTGLHIRRLDLHNFRNYAELSLCPDPGITVLTGSNAQGKTNVLEAIHLCCIGRSHRTSRDEELIRWGEQTANVRIEAEKNDGTHEIAVFLTQEGKKKKIVRVGASPVTRIGELMGHINGVLFAPEDLRLVKEGPAERRRFLDMELSQFRPAYFYALQRYVRALNQRNGLLRQLCIHPSPSLRETLQTWSDVLAQAGVEIVRHRAQFILALDREAQEIHASLSDGREKLQLSYISPLADAQDIYERFQRLLQEAAAEDLRRTTTTVGPHRDDLRLVLDGHDARNYGSQGQQRTVALSLKLAELEVMRQERNEAPVLLLDDVMSELDPQRRRLLLRRIAHVQTLVTCTHVSDLADAACGAVYEVKDGRLQQKK